MPCCAAIFCSKKPGKDNQTTFHRFPKDVAVRQQWLREIRRHTFTPSDTSVVCSDHFEESCYEVSRLRRRLRTGAVPTIFKHLIKVRKERKPPKQRNEIERNGSQISIDKDPSTSSSCQCASKEISQRCQVEHSYSNVDSPRKLKRRLDDNLASMEQMRKTLKYQRQKNQRLDKRVKSLQSIVAALRKDNLVSETRAAHLEKMSPLRISEVVRTSKTGSLFRKVARETSGENFEIPEDNKVLFAYEAKDGCNRDLVGVACYLPATPSEGSHHFLNYIFIKPYHQNMGYGAALLKRVESSMLSKARRPIRVESAKRAVGFFQKNGYICRGEGIECVCGGSPLFSSLQEMEKI